MTQKEALNQLDKYCKINNMYLISSSFSKNYYAIAIHDASQTGNIINDYGIPCHCLSCYHTPKELLIWLDGYHVGIQKRN